MADDLRSDMGCRWTDVVPRETTLRQHHAELQQFAARRKQLDNFMLAQSNVVRRAMGVQELQLAQVQNLTTDNRWTLCRPDTQENLTILVDRVDERFRRALNYFHLKLIRLRAPGPPKFQIVDNNQLVDPEARREAVLQRRRIRLEGEQQAALEQRSQQVEEPEPSRVQQRREPGPSRREQRMQRKKEVRKGRRQQASERQLQQLQQQMAGAVGFLSGASSDKGKELADGEGGSSEEIPDTPASPPPEEQTNQFNTRVTPSTYSALQPTPKPPASPLSPPPQQGEPLPEMRWAPALYPHGNGDNHCHVNAACVAVLAHRGSQASEMLRDPCESSPLILALRKLAREAQVPNEALMKGVVTQISKMPASSDITSLQSSLPALYRKDGCGNAADTMQAILHALSAHKANRHIKEQKRSAAKWLSTAHGYDDVELLTVPLHPPQTPCRLQAIEVVQEAINKGTVSLFQGEQASIAFVLRQQGNHWTAFIRAQHVNSDPQWVHYNALRSAQCVMRDTEFLAQVRSAPGLILVFKRHTEAQPPPSSPAGPPPIDESDNMDIDMDAHEEPIFPELGV